MTASPQRRRRRTQVAALLGALLLALGVGATVVGVTTLSTSQAGDTVDADVRQVRRFPETPNVAIAVVDDDDRLTSLVVATLDPSGLGGTMVTVPVNVDRDAGFGKALRPLSARPFAAGDDTDAIDLVAALEPVLGISIGFGVVLDADAVGALVDPWSPIEVDLPEDVVDDGSGSGVLFERGANDLEAADVGAVLTALDASGRSYDHHDVDVAVWEALASEVGDAPRFVQLELAADGSPAAPTTADGTIDRLFGGAVTVRDLALSAEEPTATDTTADAVVIDRRDSLLVFGSISPAVVSTPNPALAFQLVSRFDPGELAPLGDDASNETVVVDFIGELLFSGANVVSIVIEPGVDGASASPERTLVRVADETYVDDVTEVAQILFDDPEVVVAGQLVDGVDVVVELGLDALDRRARVAGEQDADEPAEDAIAGDETDEADVDTGDVDSPDGTTPEVDGDDPPGSDTVGSDE